MRQKSPLARCLESIAIIKSFTSENDFNFCHNHWTCINALSALALEGRNEIAPTGHMTWRTRAPPASGGMRAETLFNIKCTNSAKKGTQKTSSSRQQYISPCNRTIIPCTHSSVRCLSVSLERRFGRANVRLASARAQAARSYFNTNGFARYK